MSLLTMQLRNASFRGVPFSVSAAQYNAGRRTALHEYPLRDTPYVEDMGRATRQYQLTAIIVGTDYISRTKRLMAALEESGSGRLVHPWLGELTVIATAVGQAQFDDKLGRAQVDLTFVEAGEKTYPTSAYSQVAKLREQIDVVLTRIADTLDDTLQTTGVADFVTSSAATTWGDLLEVCTQTQTFIATTYGEAIQAIDFAAESIDPVGLAEKVFDCVAFYELAGTKQNWYSFASDLTQTANSSEFQTASADGLVVDSSDRIIVQNDNALKQFVRATLLVEAAGCVSFVGTDEDSSSLTGDEQTTSYDSLIGIRDSLCDSFEDFILEVDDDELAIELEALRANIYSTLTDRAEDSARILTMEFPAGLPLVVAAYQQYEDAERADEIARLNGVRHTGFSPSGGLKVLSE